MNSKIKRADLDYTREIKRDRPNWDRVEKLRIKLIQAIKERPKQ